MKKVSALLYENRFLRTQHEITEFRNALDTLRVQPSILKLAELFLLFEDSAKHSPTLEMLLEFLFTFDYRELVSATTQATPNLIQKAPVWLRVIYIRILANENGKKYLRVVLPTLLEEHKQAICQVLNELTNVDYGDEQVNSDLKQDIDSVIYS